MLYGVDQTPETYAAFEEARAQTARLAWKPYLYNPSLPHLLHGLDGLPVLVMCGADDAVAPPSVAARYAEAIPSARLRTFDGCGHRPEIERRADFVAELDAFLG
jgi:pimeloyl-ACP methyl ester carboxylesterase